MSSFSTRVLALLSSVLGGCGLLLVGVAVATDYWLLMEEGVVLQQNQSMEVKMALNSGLWRVCFVAGAEKGRCVASEYFIEPEIEITTENTANILKMVRKATAFPVVSLLFVFIAFVVSSVGHFRPQRTILAFISGIFFILAGLALVVGLVLYISSINDEVMNRPREPEQFFFYHYGWSFAFAASSFLFKEGAGVMSVYLFMKRYTEEELYHPNSTLYRPRVSDCSDYSRQYLHPDSWSRPRRGSDVSSDISIQLTRPPPAQAPPMYCVSGGGGGGASGPVATPPSSSSAPSSSSVSYPLQPPSSSSTSSCCPHPLHQAAPARSHPHPSGAPPHSLPMAQPSAAPPPRVRGGRGYSSGWEGLTHNT